MNSIRKSTNPSAMIKTFAIFLLFNFFFIDVFAQSSVTFTSTTVGWYRITTAATTQGGTIQIYNIFNNKVTDVEVQYQIGGYAVGGSIQQSRFSSYNAGNVDQVRISSDGGANTYFDIHINSAGATSPTTITGSGMLMPAFIASPVVGAVAGSTNLNVLKLSHGYNTTQGATFAQTEGNVGIGTATPDAKLTVNGTLHSKSVIVDMNIFPDYVFADNYILPSLPSVNAFIKRYRHLPESPSEKDVIEKGMNVGEINSLLFKKVEELTLYLIEKDNQLKQQQRINQLQDQRLKRLERKFDK